MKKTNMLIILLFLATLSQAQAGRIRMSFAGFDCYRETWDDMLQADGKVDEVYLNFGFNMASKNGASKFKYEKWTGTYGNGAASTPNLYSFQLNANGSMQLIGANGAMLANGTYSFSDNQLTGTYKYTNGGNFSISALLSGNTLNGSWGSGTSSTGGEKWVMTKN